jgi:hypothetical protein
MPVGIASDAALNEAKKAAGPEVINVTMIIPLVLIVAFTILLFYMRNRKHKDLLTVPAA